MIALGFNFPVSYLGGMKEEPKSKYPGIAQVLGIL